MAGMSRGMNNFGGRGQGKGGLGSGQGRQPNVGGPGAGQGRGRGYGQVRQNIMDFSDTDDLSQLIHCCSHYLKQSEMSNLGGTQQKILGILHEQGDISQRELMGILHVKSGSLSEIIKKLEIKGFVEKLPNPNDRRSVVISLTPSGAKQLSDCEHGDCSCSFSTLDDEKKEELRGLLKELLNSWYDK